MSTQSELHNQNSACLESSNLPSPSSNSKTIPDSHSAYSIKLFHNDTIRRTRLEKPSFLNLKHLVKSTFPRCEHPKLYYIDEEDDRIYIQSEPEFQESIEIQKSLNRNPRLLKFHVESSGSKSSQKSQAPQHHPLGPFFQQILTRLDNLPPNILKSITKALSCYSSDESSNLDLSTEDRATIQSIAEILNISSSELEKNIHPYLNFLPKPILSGVLSALRNSQDISTSNTPPPSFFDSWRSRPHPHHPGHNRQRPGFHHHYPPHHQFHCSKSQPRSHPGTSFDSKFSSSSDNDKPSRCPFAQKMPTLKSRYIRDVSVYDGTVIDAGTCVKMTKIWRIQNSGASPWPSGTRLVQVSGDILSPTPPSMSDALTEPVQPGEERDFSVDIVSPTSPGRYIAYYRLQHEKFFGQRFWIDIFVRETNTRNVSDTDTQLHKALQVTNDLSNDSNESTPSSESSLE